jgi:hypothetical protein
VEGSLLDSDGQALTGELNGHTYIVPGMLFAYNTGGKSFQFGAGKYIDSDYSDFKKSQRRRDQAHHPVAHAVVGSVHQPEHPDHRGAEP